MRLASVFAGLFFLLVARIDVSALDHAHLRDPRPTGWALDYSGQLKPDTRDALDALGHAVKHRTGHELVVVAVASTDGENQRAFATRLFNRWQLGDRIRNDGILLFVALRDRRVEFVLGTGIDSDADVEVTQRIIDQNMLPRFRAGDPDAAVLAGARACAQRLLAMTSTTGTAAPATSLRVTGDTVQLDDQPIERDITRPTTPDATPQGTTPPATGMVHTYAPSKSNDSSWQLWGLVGGGGGGIAGFFWWRRWLRNRPRTCDRCQHPMVRLGESEDDQHLNHTEKTEERVGSVDYDLWCCTACPHVVKLRYGAWFTSYARCPQCHAVTKNSNETTLVAANYDHGGQVRVDETCVACQYRNSFTRSTPRLTRSQSGNRRGFGGSGGRSGGGGRCSGRGGGGGW